MPRWTITKPTELDFDHVRMLRVYLAAGSVDVIGTDEESRLAVTETDGEPLAVRYANGELVVCHAGLGWRGILSEPAGQRPRATLALAVPWDCRIQVGVVTASALVAGVHDRASVRSVAGPVRLTGLTDEVDVQTISGDLRTDSLAGDLCFSTVCGDLTVVDGSSGSLRAESVSGAVRLDLALVKGGRVDVTTVSGELRLRLPYEPDARLDVLSTTGRVDCPFEELAAEDSSGVRRVAGVLGDGSASVVVRTVSGDVALERRERLQSARWR